jgi:TPR repeat protein
MAKTCPSCKSINIRRSVVRTSESVRRRLLLSPYRCRDCRTRFWVIGKKAYYLAGLVGSVMVVAVIVWNVAARPALPPSDPADVEAAAEAAAQRLSDVIKRADQNDPAAELELAGMYKTGAGVEANARLEYIWLERAARHGNVRAQYEYGIALREGRGTVQDYAGALKWMQLAAEGGNGPAQLALGNMYRTGLGMPANNIKAYVWLNVAAAQGVAGAATARDAVLSYLAPAELQEAQAEARRFSALYIPKAKPPQ